VIVVRPLFLVLPIRAQLVAGCLLQVWAVELVVGWLMRWLKHLINGSRKLALVVSFCPYIQVIAGCS
jgi:hypothetical protein